MSIAAPPPVRQPVHWLAATRPQFITITVVAVLVGLAASAHDGIAIDTLRLVLTLIGAIVVHAGANLVNDYHDRDGDARNEERLSPFTGGSRVIQQGLFSPRAAALYGYALLALAAAIGALLALTGRPALWTVGAAGLLLAVLYSAPPLRLSARGLGEFVITGAWLLVVLGADLVQRGSWSITALAAGLPIGLLVAAILHVNEFPDRAADAASGKQTIVVQLGPRLAAWAYLALVLAAYLWLAFAAFADVLPRWTLIGWAALPLSLFAAIHLIRHAGRAPTTVLMPAIKATIAAAHLNGLLIAAALLFTAR